MSPSPRRLVPFVVTGLVGLALVAVAPAPASAHPDHCAELGKGEVSEECVSDEALATLDDSAATLPPNEIASSPNVRRVANLPKTGPFEPAAALNSDLAFWGDFAIQGNYSGFNIVDISAPARPRQVAQVLCPGSQNDVSVWGNLIFTSTDSSRNTSACEDNVAQPATAQESWEGIRVFDWSNPAEPKLVTAVETECGSHTHTLLPEPQNNRALLYVSSYGPNAATPDCQPPHDKISIVEVPLDDPSASSVIATPVLFPDGGFPGVVPADPNDLSQLRTSTTSGCHDITVYQAIGLAAGACMGQGVIMDISDSVNPRVISSVTDPFFAFWHSATFSNDGKTVVFTDELLGGGGPTCNPTIGPRRGANGIYDISDPANPKFASYYKIRRTQSNTENCVAHNGSVLPVPGRDVMVQAWYQGGTSVFDFTDPYNPREIAWFDYGPLSDTELVTGGAWSSYFYNGRIYVSEIQRGFDVLRLTHPAVRESRTVPYFNAQTQEPLGI